MNRFLFLFTFSTTVFFSASGQTKTTKDSLLDVICKCATSKKAELANGTADDLQKAIELCFVSNGIDLLMKYAKEQNVDFTDQEAMQKLGMGLGIDLVKMCPAVMELSMQIANNNGASKKLNVDTAKVALPTQDIEVKETDGTVVAVHTTTYPANIELKQADGSIKKLYIISEFYTSDDKFYNTAYMTGKKVKVGFSKQKVFMPVSKKFEEIEVIFSLNHP